MGLIDAELKLEDVLPQFCPPERGPKNLNLSDEEQLIFFWYLLGLGDYGLQFGQRHFGIRPYGAPLVKRPTVGVFNTMDLSGESGFDVGITFK